MEEGIVVSKVALYSFTRIRKHCLEKILYMLSLMFQRDKKKLVSIPRFVQRNL